MYSCSSFLTRFLHLFLFFASITLYGQDELPFHKGRLYTPYEKSILSIIKGLERSNKYTSSISQALSGNELPIGVLKKIGNVNYVLAIDSAQRKGNGWVFSAYMAVLLPKSGPNSEIVFAARNINFNPEGIGSLSATRLELLSKHEFDISSDVSVEFSKTNGVSNNYITFDCNGYKDVSLEGKFKFSRNLIIPAPAQAVVGATVPTTGGIEDRVTATLRIVMPGGDLNNMLITTSISPFSVKGVEDLIFEVQEASIDMSDISNPAGFSFPPNYISGLAPEDINLWQGFFLKELRITFKGVERKANSPLPTFLATNVLIDDTGLTGNFSGMDLIDLEDGTIGGWAISVKKLRARIVQNNLLGASIDGQMRVPFLGSDTLGYGAMIDRVDDHLDYSFAIRIVTTQSFNMPLGTTAVLRNGSSIAVSRVNGVRRVNTVLNGSLGSGQENAQFTGILFDNLKLNTNAPYIESGTFSLVSGSAPKCRGFGISLTNISLNSIDSVRTSLRLTAGINFTGGSATAPSGATTSSGGTPSSTPPPASGTNISANATIDFITLSQTVLDENVRRRTWSLERVKVNDITINCQVNSFKLRGTIAVWDNDPIYGNGFKGGIALEVNAMEFAALIYFGNKQISSTDLNRFRYFGINVYGRGLTIPCPAPFYITGIMGGFAYHMRNTNFNPNYTNISNPTGIGYTLEGVGTQVSFVPDNTMGLLFRAGINFEIKPSAGGTGKAAVGDARLEVAFQANGSLSYINFQGAIYMMPDDAASANKLRRQIPDPNQSNYASIMINYDHANRCLHAVAEAYLKTANIRGSGLNGRIGQVVIHIDPNDWYIYIGSSSNMLGVTINGFASVNAYFMIGTMIEGMPPLPTAVAALLKVPLQDERNQNQLSGGRGFAFGAHLSLAINKRWAIFYVDIAVMAGLDVMIINFGPGVSCVGHSGRPGIDGWFAQGRIYVYLALSGGLRAKGINFSVIDIRLAIMLRMSGPNPSWFAGQVAGTYSVLGGWVSGSFNCEFEAGEKCVLQRDPGASEVTASIIQNVKPDAAAVGVSVFSTPQASFNTPMNVAFTVDDLNGTTSTDYRLQLKSFQVLDGNTPLAGVLRWNTANTVVSLRTTDVLPANKSLVVRAVIKWEKKVGSNWVAVVKPNGTPEEETKEASFTTGDAPDTMEGNVVYAYPVKNQYNLYKNEHPTGFVHINQGTPDLFRTTDLDGKSWTYEVRFDTPGASTLSTPFTYDNSIRQASFTFPVGLSLDKVYKMRFVKLPQTTASRSNNVVVNTNTNNLGNGNTVVTTTNQLQNTVTLGEKALYEGYFRTSKFNTFATKVASLGSGTDNDFAVGGVFFMYKSLTGLQESFDDMELNDFSFDVGTLIPSLVFGEAISTQPWIANNQYPNLYEYYLQDARVSLTRNTNFLGVTPLKGIQITTASYQLTPLQINTGTATAIGGNMRINYYLPLYARADYDELRSKAILLYVNNPTAIQPISIQRLLSYSYAQISAGVYQTNLKYRLPNGTITSTVPIFTFKRP